MHATETFQPWPFRLAALTALVTLLLIVVGGLVTNTGSALAVPDWPTTFGHNMFTYPPSQMVGGIFYEHSHRLLGSLVGMLTIGLCFTLWRFETRRWVRRLGVVALLGVIAQGILGGMRVVLLEHGLAVIHGCFAEAFFGLAVSLAVVTSRAWFAGISINAAPPKLRLLARALPVCVYIQMVLGAFVTHRGALVWFHIGGAGAVLVLAASLGAMILPRRDESVRLRRPAALLLGLLGVQLSLGLGAYLWHFTQLSDGVPFLAGLSVLALHRFTGAAVWATSVVLSLRLLRAMGKAAHLGFTVAARPQAVA